MRLVKKTSLNGKLKAAAWNWVKSFVDKAKRGEVKDKGQDEIVEASLNDKFPKGLKVMLVDEWAGKALFGMGGVVVGWKHGALRVTGSECLASLLCMSTLRPAQRS
jgi:hypothetical protein